MEKLGCIKTKKTKFILSLISGIVYILGMGVLMSSGGLSVYILSYIHHKDKWVDMQYGNLMMPFILLFISMFSPLAGPLEQFCGPIVCMLISTIISEICLFLFYIQRNIWFFYSISILVGLGVGISANIPIKNACFYYPEKKGLISASIMSFVAVGTAIYILVGEQLINPEKRGVIDQETDPYYPEDISERVKNYFIFGMFVLPIGSILSCLFFYKYNPICETEEKENEKNGEPDEENEENEGNEETENEKKEELKEDFIKKNVRPKKLNSFYKPSPSKNIKKALKSCRFWRNIIIAGVMPFWVCFIQASFRAYVVMLGVDTNIIFYLGSGLSLIGCILGPIWATLVDKFGFQPIMKIIGFICSLMPIYFYLFMGDKFYYPIGLIISVSTFIGIMSALTPHLMHIYGIRYFLTIGGLARLFNDLSGFLAALTSIIISIFYKNAEELLFPYQMIVAGGGVLSVIGLILVFFENDEKYNFGDEDEENRYLENGEADKQNDTFEKEKNYINENASTILDVTNSSRTTLNTNDNIKNTE